MRSRLSSLCNASKDNGIPKLLNCQINVQQSCLSFKRPHLELWSYLASTLISSFLLINSQGNKCFPKNPVTFTFFRNVIHAYGVLSGFTLQTFRLVLRSHASSATVDQCWDKVLDLYLLNYELIFIQSSSNPVSHLFPWAQSFALWFSPYLAPSLCRMSWIQIESLWSQLR